MNQPPTEEEIKRVLDFVADRRRKEVIAYAESLAPLLDGLFWRGEIVDESLGAKAVLGILQDYITRHNLQ